MGLGTYGGDHHAGHHHFDILFAIAAHTVPVVAVVTMAFYRERGLTHAALRGLGLAIASVIGVLFPSLIPEAEFHAIEPWLTAAVAGLLLHVVAHDWNPERRPTGIRARLVDLGAVGAGLVLVTTDSGHHHGGGEVREEMATALLELSLETAPALLFGLAIGALLTALGTRLPNRWLRSGGALRQAFRGALVGAPLPICACGVLPLAASLRKRGASAALVVAFLIATPELGVETFLLTGRFVGWPFAAVRLVSAVALAMIAALALSRAISAQTGGLDGSIAPEAPPPDTPFARRFLESFDELLYHVAPWTVVGLIAAAYVQAVLPTGSLSSLTPYGLDILIVAVVAVPSYVCAASATPLANTELMATDGDLASIREEPAFGEAARARESREGVPWPALGARQGGGPGRLLCRARSTRGHLHGGRRAPSGARVPRPGGRRLRRRGDRLRAPGRGRTQRSHRRTTTGRAPVRSRGTGPER